MHIEEDHFFDAAEVSKHVRTSEGGTDDDSITEEGTEVDDFHADLMKDMIESDEENLGSVTWWFWALGALLVSLVIISVALMLFRK